MKANRSFTFLRAQKKHLDETDAVYRFFKQKNYIGLMVDVGVHTGSASLPFIDLGWKVIGFEPNPLNAKHFFNKLSSRTFSKQSNCDIREIALSDKKTEPLKLFYSDISSGISGLSSFHESHQKLKEVEVCTLREQLNNLHQKIDFLKVDTEGFDLFVLKGFDWEASRPAIIECEFEDSKTLSLGYSWKQLADYLVEKGYFLLVSEWHPITQYGVQHDWRCIKEYPCELEDSYGWGNILAFESDQLRQQFRLFFIEQYLITRNYQPVSPGPVFSKINHNKCNKIVDSYSSESSDAFVRIIYQGHFLPGTKLCAQLVIDSETECDARLLLIRHGDTTPEKTEESVRLTFGINTFFIKHECVNYHPYFSIQLQEFKRIVIHSHNLMVDHARFKDLTLFSDETDVASSISLEQPGSISTTYRSESIHKDEMFYNLENLLIERSSTEAFEALLPVIGAIASHTPTISVFDKLNVLDLLAQSQLKASSIYQQSKIQLSVSNVVTDEKSEGIRSLVLNSRNLQAEWRQDLFTLAKGIYLIELEAEIFGATLILEIVNSFDETPIFIHNITQSDDKLVRLHRFVVSCADSVHIPCFIRVRFVESVKTHSASIYGISLTFNSSTSQVPTAVISQPLLDDYAETKSPVFRRNTGEPCNANDIDRLYSLHNRFKGERIFIMGNGPSLNHTPLESLKDEYVFGLNRCSLLFPRISWRPTFYTAFDVRVVPDNAEEFSNIDIKYKFFSARYKRLLGLKENHYWHHVKAYYEGFSEAFTDHAPYLGFGGGGTIGVMAIELAFFMGFDPIYLIGTDVSYSVKSSVDQTGDAVHGDGIKLQLQSTEDDDDNHFDPRYFGKGKKWHNPNPSDMMIGFGRAYEYMKARDRSLLNATVGGKLNTVPRVNFESLF